MAFVNKSWNVVEKNVKLHDTKLSTKMYQIHISATMKWLKMIVVAGKQFFEEVGIHFRQHALRANHLVAVTLSTVSYFSALTENKSSAAALSNHHTDIICCPLSYLLVNTVLSTNHSSINHTDIRVMYVSFRDHLPR